MEPNDEKELLFEMVLSLEAEARVNGYNLYDSTVSWRSNWAKSANRVINRYNVEEICCPYCGKSTGLDRKGFMRAIPKEGLKCSACNHVVIYGDQATL